MPRWFTRWTPALRMARRDARRHKGRTALVLLMIMLPVLAGTVALTILRSSQPTDATYADLMLGEEAQARLTATCAGTVLQDVRGEQGACDMTEPREPAGRDEVVQQLPASSALVQELTATVGARAGDRSLPSVSVVEVDAREIPGRYTTTDGRLPEHAGEVALAPADSEALDVSVDDTVTLTTSEDNSVEATVTGVLAPQWGSPHTIAHPGTIPGLASQAGEASDSAWYVVGPEPVSWGHVLDLNDIGVTVVSRAVIADPPSDSDIPLNRITAPAAPDMQTIGIIAAVLGVGLLEIILLIGPAFTVGARRSTRQLAVLAASGGAPADLRRVVLASGVVLGLLAGVLGAATGLVLAWALIEVLRNYHIVLPGLVLPLAEITGLVALAVALGVAASWLPARRASQQDIVAALAGRRSEAAPRRGTPWVGLALVVAGLVAALTGGLSGQAMMLLAGALAMETGLILAAGGIIALAGRLAPRLGPAARIALRDAARQRGRTAPAVAAVIAAVAGMAGAAV
ncbi:MAG TPA: FtsX-like permease family protein, partial [Jiangellaceae bacterium]|nr:FtsX-like permease family protein [Jiangellaceae bacterium]